MLNHCLSLGSWFFSRWILNSNHSERGYSNQSSQKSQAEQPTDNVGAGWLFIAAAFTDGKWPNWTSGSANGQMTQVKRSDLSTTVTLLVEQVMLTPRSETNLSQRRRSQSLAGKYLLGTQRDFSRNFHRFWLSITTDLSFENLYPS